MKAVILESLGINAEQLKRLEAPLKAKGIDFVCYARTNEQERLKAEIADADIAILANMPLNNEAVEAGKHLKFIDVAFTGVDHIGLAAAERKKIAVSNASGYANEAVAELAVGAVLSEYRALRKMEDACRSGMTKGMCTGQEIKGKTVGIIGLGKIGRRSAELFSAFGAHIIACRKHPAEKNDEIRILPLDEVLKQSDIVLLHCPLNEETRGMINAQKLAQMKPNAILVNMARGPIVNTEDLIDALQKKQIAGAVLDVFDQEPPLAPADPLLALDNVLVTPHIGFATAEAMEIRAEIVFDNLQSWLDGCQKNKIL
jgi:D-3-phosphoglycerate dehydrogenase